MKNEKDIFDELTNGVLSENMDFGTREYEDFKLLIRSKAKETSGSDKIFISLLGLKYQMQDQVESNSKINKVGSYIKKFIKLIGVKQIEFAKYLDMKPSNLSKLLSGERRLNIEFALILEQLSNINAETWLRVQSKNELQKIQSSYSNRIRKYKLKELTR